MRFTSILFDIFASAGKVIFTIITMIMSLALGFILGALYYGITSGNL